MPLPPSRRDITGPPPRNTSDLAKITRHHDSYLRQIDPGLQGGRFGTPRPVPKGPSQIVGSDGGGGEDSEIAWEWGDRHTVTATGTQIARLSHYPIEDSLFMRWHPGGDGAKALTNEHFTVLDNIVTIPDPLGIFAVNDTFSFQYEYEIDDDVVEPALVGVTSPGTWAATPKTLTYDLPAGTAAGDLMVLTLRGQVAAGGGEVILDVSCADPRVTLVKRATSLNGPDTIVEAIWVGVEDGSGAPVVVNVTQNPSYNAWGKGVLATFTGVNGYGTVSATESGSSTPTVAGVAAVAVIWMHGTSFSPVNAGSPSGYTLANSTGSDYYSTSVSWWYDPDAAASPSGTFAGEGCCVIAIT